MTLPVLEYNSPGIQKPRPLLSLLEKIVLWLLGVLLPLICFGITACTRYPFAPEWQSGGWYRYILFIPDGRTGYPFYPLLLYCIVALGAFLTRPGTSRLLIVRLGLYSGVILGLQYTCIQCIGADSKFFLMMGIGLASNLVLFGVIKGLERIPPKAAMYLGISLVVLVLASIFVPMGPGNARIGGLAGEIFGFAGIASLLFAPAWCCGVYLRASLLALKLNRNPDRQGIPLANCLAWIPWLGGYALAWRWSIGNAIALYSTLPTAAPGCYIATAAAAGHPKFVGSTAARAADGSTFPANQQLRRLKCVEIALATVCLTGHRMIRCVYDRVGPPLARLIALHPLAGDLAFVMLKPLEWLTYGMLMVVVPDAGSKISRVYAGYVSQSRPA